ncbi:MAG: sigma-E factor negative regulatory protein RseC [Pseudothermotoga sp.]|nr:sigma-E factor negative regulatory protein RseC [Pseudothermotoga sp.]
MEVIRLIDKNTVELRFSRSSLCNHCFSKGSCNLFESSKELVLKAIKPESLELEVGDIVVVEHKDFSVTKLSALVYGIPLVIFITFLTLFIAIFKNELYGFLGGLLTLILSFVFLKVYDKRFGKKYKPIVVEKYNNSKTIFGEFKG